MQKNESVNLTNQQHKTLKHNVTWRNQHKDDIYFQKLKTACISLQQRFEPSGKSRPWSLASWHCQKKIWPQWPTQVGVVAYCCIGDRRTVTIGWKQREEIERSRNEVSVTNFMLDSNVSGTIKWLNRD